MTGGFLSGLLLGWALAAGAAIAGLAFVTNVRGRWPTARGALALLAGAQPRGLEGVVLQEGAFGCGKAALGTLYHRLGRPERAGEVERRVPASMPLSMLEMSDLLGESGLSAAGYEFQSVDQLRVFAHGRPGGHALVLLNDYGSASPLLGLLLFPYRLLSWLHRKAAGPRRSLHHWAVLDGAEPAGVVLLDPFLGRVAWNRRRFARIWTGWALFVAPQGPTSPTGGPHAVD